MVADGDESGDVAVSGRDDEHVTTLIHAINAFSTPIIPNSTPFQRHFNAISTPFQRHLIVTLSPRFMMWMAGNSMNIFPLMMVPLLSLLPRTEHRIIETRRLAWRSGRQSTI